jgi:hypothetical protein
MVGASLKMMAARRIVPSCDWMREVEREMRELRAYPRTIAARSAVIAN